MKYLHSQLSKTIGIEGDAFSVALDKEEDMLVGHKG